jgi:transposase
VIRARAGLVRARTALVNTARSLAKSYGGRLRGCNVRNMNPEKAEGLSPELQAALEPLLNAIESLSERIVEYNDRIEALAATQLSAGRVTEADQGSRHAHRADLFADLGRSASFPQEPGRGLLSGAAAGAQKLGAKRAADAHQQGMRPVPANLVGARSATHSGTIRGGL